MGMKETGNYINNNIGRKGTQKYKLQNTSAKETVFVLTPLLLVRLTEIILTCIATEDLLCPYRNTGRHRFNH